MMHFRAAWFCRYVFLAFVVFAVASCQPSGGDADPDDTSESAQSASPAATDQQTAQKPTEPAVEQQAKPAQQPEAKPAPKNDKLALSTPNGGETWRLAREYDITWKAKDLTGDIGLHLKKGGRFVGWIAWRVPATDESYTWRIRAEEYEPGDNYTVTVFSRENEAIRDSSDSAFNIGQYVKQEDGEAEPGDSASQ
jgi:pyruvate/2-oxoglutarate dehydrogenase complex dihydrolipoamide acyltransferase (E2) component